MQADGGRLGARERHDVELEALGLVEAVLLDGVEHPAYRPEFEDADRDLGRRLDRLAETERCNGGNQEC